MMNWRHRKIVNMQTKSGEDPAIGLIELWFGRHPPLSPLPPSLRQPNAMLCGHATIISIFVSGLDVQAARTLRPASGGGGGINKLKL